MMEIIISSEILLKSHRVPDPTSLSGLNSSCACLFTDAGWCKPWKLTLNVLCGTCFDSVSAVNRPVTHFNVF